jgi:hypothetical protein
VLDIAAEPLAGFLSRHQTTRLMNNQAPATAMLALKPFTP